MQEEPSVHATGSAPNAGQESAEFTPPPGWRKSEKKSTSNFAFEMSRTTSWYANDGQGNGYFAPGWDSERIARRTGVFVWIGLVMAVLIIIGGSVLFFSQYSEQRAYDRLKTEGIQTTGTVTDIQVEHSTYRGREGRRSYTTITSATVHYAVDGQEYSSPIEDRRSGFRKFTETSYVRSPENYPDPSWAEGQSVSILADRENPRDVVLHKPYLERDTGKMPVGGWIAIIATGALLIIPALFIRAGIVNMRKAREL